DPPGGAGLHRRRPLRRGQGARRRRPRRAGLGAAADPGPLHHRHPGPADPLTLVSCVTDPMTIKTGLPAAPPPAPSRARPHTRPNRAPPPPPEPAAVTAMVSPGLFLVPGPPSCSQAPG